MCCTLLIGGHETTANQINLSLLLLLDHPGEVAKLRADPELIPGAVEELLRCSRLGGLPPARVTREDVQIGGVSIPAGEQVMPLFGTANRDPSVFSRSGPVRRHPRRSQPPILRRRRASLPRRSAGPGRASGGLPRPDRPAAGLRLAVPASELEFKPGMAIHSLRELPVLWGEP